MSSYNSRKKEYAKKLLNNHIKDNFYNGTKPEVKYSIITKDGITDVDSKLVDYLSSETGLTRIQATDLVINEYNNFKKKYEHDRMIYNINQPTYEQKFKKYERDYKKSEFHNKNRLIMRIDQYSNYNFHESEDLGMYNEEELLEAVEILMEDYGYDEEEAIDLLMESFEEDDFDLIDESYEDDDFDDEELDELSEAVDLLMEDYDLTEDEAIDLVLEATDEEKENKRRQRKEMFDSAKKGALEELSKHKKEIALGIATTGFKKGKKLYNQYKTKKEYEAYKERNKSPLQKLKDKHNANKEKSKKARKRRLKQKMRRRRIKRVKKALHLK